MALTTSRDYPPAVPGGCQPSLSFDIVVATIGRSKELERLLSSLAAQSLGALRVIVVDQNADDRLIPVLARHADVRHIHLRSQPGLSRARNVGLRAVEAEVVAFADDDCWYAPGLLAEVSGALQTHPHWDGVSGRVVDELGHPSAARWSKRAGRIDRLRVWTQGVSVSIFLRRHVVEAIGSFDETLGFGAGAGWESGEETDYLLRSLEHGLHIEYVPSLVVFHPQTLSEPDAAALGKARLHGQGTGRVLRNHHYPWWFVAYQTFRSIGGAALAICAREPRKARFHLAVARGRYRGWRRREPQRSE